MFTGLVEEVGTIRSVAPVGEGARVTIAASTVLGDVEMGASIAVNGCCLTVVEWGDDWWAADAVPETMDRTNLGGLAPGDPVNLERPLAANGRYGGHVVQGHVDGTGEVHSIEELDDGSWRFTFTLPSELANYVVEREHRRRRHQPHRRSGHPSTFSIAIIPHTFAVTAMGQRNVGDTVNLEADVLAKYVERLVRPAQ